jgi:hypothetical protein
VARRAQALLRMQPNLALHQNKHRLLMDIGVSLAETTLQRSMRTQLRYSRKRLLRMSLRKLLPANVARYKYYVGVLQLPAADCVFVDEFGVDPLEASPQHGWCAHACVAR